MVYVETSTGCCGSAIYVGKQYLLTAAHVVGDETSVQVEFQDPNSIPVKKSPMKYEATVVTKGNVKLCDEDYALLKLKYVNGSDFANPCDLGISKNVKIGDKIKVVGYPVNPINGCPGDYSSTDGTINNINGGDQKSASIFVVDAGAWPGNSGGALKNQNDQLIGLVIMKGIDPEYSSGKTYVLKIDGIRSKLKSYGLPF